MNDQAFGKTRWGMSRKEVEAIFPPSASDVEVTMESDGGVVEDGFEAEFSLSGQFARANFGFSNDKLSIVHVDIYVQKDAFEQYCSMIKSATSKTFGPPVNDDGSVAFWRTPSSEIFFRYDDKDTGGPDNNIIRVDLKYERRI